MIGPLLIDRLPEPMLRFLCACGQETKAYPWLPIEAGRTEHVELFHFLEAHRISCGRRNLKAIVRHPDPENTPLAALSAPAPKPRLIGKYLGLEVWEDHA